MAGPAVHDLDVVVRGLRLRTTQAGVGRPLLLLHGFTGARTDFELHMEALAELGFHVVAPDQRGHGDSDKPEPIEAYCWDEYVADALALADGLGWDRFTLLGHSMGGMIALRVALAAPDRLHGLVLMDTAGEAPPLDRHLLDAAISVALEHGTGVIADLSAGRDGPLDTEPHKRLVAADPSYEARGDRNLRVSSDSMYAAMVAAIAEQEPIHGSLTAVACPTLVLVGAEDDAFLGPSERLAAAIPGAHLAIVAGGGHSPQFESPDEWFAALSGFLATVG